MDNTLEEASADVGAGEWATFRRGAPRRIAPGAVGGAPPAFIVSMDGPAIAHFTAGVDSTAPPVFIHGMPRRGVKPEIDAIATPTPIFSFLVASLGLYPRRRS